MTDYEPIALSPNIDDYEPEAVEAGNASVLCGYCDFAPFCHEHFGPRGARCPLPRPFVYKQKDYKVKGVCDRCRADCADWLAVDGSRRLCAACYYPEVYAPAQRVANSVFPKLEPAVFTYAPYTPVDVCMQQAQTLEGLRKMIGDKDEVINELRRQLSLRTREKFELEKAMVELAREKGR